MLRRRQSEFIKKTTFEVVNDRCHHSAVLVEDVVEFHNIVSKSLLQMSGTWSLNSFFNGSDAIAFASALDCAPDVVLVDLGLPDVDGAEVISHFNYLFPATPILVFSVFAQKDKVLKSFAAGASGYVLKDDDVFCTATSIMKALDGDVPISPSIGRHLLQRSTAEARHESKFKQMRLSARETALLKLLVEGTTYAQAAHRMGLKESTVHSYSKSLFRKMGVNSRYQAVAYVQNL